ncbi:hypothetical protein ABID25_006517 [Mesorhizobium abyssinicae]
MLLLFHSHHLLVGSPIAWDTVEDPL